MGAHRAICGCLWVAVLALVPAPAQEVRVTVPEGATEPALALDPTGSGRVVAGTYGPGEQVRMHYSTDGGTTWIETGLPLGNTCCSPSVEWSSSGAFAYATALAHCQLNRCDVNFYRSSDGGVNWDDLESESPGSPRRTLSQRGDREFLHVDRHPDSPYRDRVYATFNEDGVIHVTYSSDFGDTWGGVAFSNQDAELGFGADIATDGAGTVFVAWPAYNSKTIRLSRSSDGGATFGASSVVAAAEAARSYRLPSQESRMVRPYVVAAADNGEGAYAASLYLAWSDTNASPSVIAAENHSIVRVAYSRDGGETWSTSVPHSLSDQAQVDRWHPFLAVDAEGVVHVVFYDTRSFGDRSGVDLYYAFSTDGAQTWAPARRITTVASPNVEGAFEFGDYNALDIVAENLIAGFADNRNEVSEPEDSVDVYAADIEPGLPSSGPGRIYGSLGLDGAPLTVRLNENGSDLDLDWAPACGEAFDYAVYEGQLGDPASKQALLCSTGGETGATVTPASGQRFYLVVALSNASEGSYGRSSSGDERAPDEGACSEQSIGECP